MKENNDTNGKRMEAFKPPPFLNFSNANLEDWKLWLQKLNLYLEVSGNADGSDSKKIAILLYSIGDMGLRLFNTFDASGEELSYVEVVKKFNDYFEPRKGILSQRKNVVYERYRFLTFRQKTQSNACYLNELKDLVLTCDYLEEENMVRDAFIAGVTDKQLKRRLLEVKNLTLLKLEDILRYYETNRTVVLDQVFQSSAFYSNVQHSPINRLGVKPKRREGAQIEEVEVSDDPPNYEPPPDYAEIMKMEEETKKRKSIKLKCSRGENAIKESEQSMPIPDSPPPPYSDTQQSNSMVNDGGHIGNDWTTFESSMTVPGCSTSSVFGSSIQHHIDISKTTYISQENNSGSSSGTSSVNENRCPYDFSKLWNIFPGKHFNTRELVEQQTCNCEGACGCANTRRARSESVTLPSMAATWSPATTKFKEIDVSHRCEEGKIRNLFFSSSNRKGTIKGSTSADNLHYLN